MNIKTVSVDDYTSCKIALVYFDSYAHICIWGKYLHLYSGDYDNLDNCFHSEQKLICVSL